MFSNNDNELDKKGAKTARMPTISDDIKEIEFDEMWYFLEQKKTKNGYSKQLIGFEKRLSRGSQVTTTLQHSKSSTTK
ncbi:hypothetical protein FACS189449_11390 [Alphaproteobacteria bacterium]|nr:hypothetical protein FACS189449_11390 [Alphaproteobacteria bacterium]